MIPRHLHRWLLLVGSLIVLAGCRSAPPKTPSADALAVEPESVMERRAEAHAHYAQGVILELDQRNDEALEEYHRAAKLDPGNEELVAEVARRWILQKKPERALEILKAGAARPDAPAVLDVLLGTAYLQMGKSSLAVEANQRAIRKAPALLAGYQNLHADYLQDGRVDEAMKVLDSASREQGTDPDFLIGLAELYVNFATAVPSVKPETYPKALALLNRAAAKPIPTVQSRIRLADGFNVLGQTDQAIAMYQSLLADFPQAPMLQENLRAKLADIYLRGKDRNHALEQLEMITRNDPMNVQAHYYLALLSAEAGDPARAEQHLRQILVLNPKFEQAYYDLAAAQISLQKTNEVLATMADAQKRFGETFVSEYILGVAQAAAGNFNEAVRHYASAEVIARATDPKRLTPTFYFQMAVAHDRKGEYSDAVRDLERALEMDPNFAEGANFLGYMWAERGENLDRAKELIDRAVKAEPKNDAFLDSLAWVLFKQGHPKDALPVMEQAIDLAVAAKDLDPTLYDHLGDIRAAVGDAPGARAAWRKALDLGPNDDIRKKLEAPLPP
jgi:tetratricopeptide (TPR) repeat protein